MPATSRVRRLPTLARRLSALAVAALLGAATPAAAAVIGPDVSSFQHPKGFTINWSAAHATSGVAFAFVKASEGTTYANPYFVSDFAALGAAGVVRGAYHFARPSAGTASALAQADHFVAVAGTLAHSGELPAVLDLEVNGGLSPAALSAWTKAYLDRVRYRTGRTPILYTYPSFWRSSMANTTAFRGYPLWVATYSATPSLFGGWSTYTFWQYTDAGKVAGMPGPVDVSVYHGTLSQLRALARIPAPAPKPVPTPAPTPTPSHEPTPVPAPAPVRPSTPRAVHIGVTPGWVTLAWAPPAQGVPVTYQVRLDQGPARSLPASTRTWAVAATGAANHTLTLTASNRAGSSPVVTQRVFVPVPRALTAPRTQLVPLGGTAGVQATLTRTDTRRPQRAVRVTATFRPHNGARASSVSALTDTLGRVRFLVRPAVSTDVVLTIPATASAGAVSTRVTLAVLPSLSARLYPAVVAPGRATTLAGRTSPALRGQRVWLQLFTAGQWRHWVAAQVSGTGAYRFIVWPQGRASAWRVWVAATSLHAQGASAAVVARVR